MGKLVRNEREGYYSFVPPAPPVELKTDSELLDLLSRASQKLGELKGIESTLGETIGFSARLFVQPYLKKEAVLSSKIEGTMSTLHEVLEADALSMLNGEESRGDLLEVINYMRAQDMGIKMIMEGNEVNKELVMRLHQTLLSHVRGERDMPGILRKVQNYISRPGFPSIKDAVYVPPPSELVPGLLDGLFQYMAGDHMPTPIKIALMHYQFEAIHPFLDGNGRIGRLLIILYLIKEGALGQPLLYMSGYFEKNRDEYYRLLLEVSAHGDYGIWVKFFLKGVIEQSDSVIAKSAKLLSYRIEIRKILVNAKGKVVQNLIDTLFTHPLITIPMIARMLKISYPAAKAAVEEAMKYEILRPQARINGKRPRIFIAPKIFDIYNV